MESKQQIRALRVEQDVDHVLKNLKLKILNQPHDEVLMMTDSRYKIYKANEDRIFLKNGRSGKLKMAVKFRKNFGETISVKYYQNLIPKQLDNEVLRNLHGGCGKHPGISKSIIAYWEIFFPKYGAPNQGVDHVM